MQSLLHCNVLCLCSSPKNKARTLLRALCQQQKLRSAKAAAMRKMNTMLVTAPDMRARWHPSSVTVVMPSSSSELLMCTITGLGQLMFCGNWASQVLEEGHHWQPWLQLSPLSSM